MKTQLIINETDLAMHLLELPRSIELNSVLRVMLENQRARAFTTKAGTVRRHQRCIGVGRDVFGQYLMIKYGLKSFGTLTKAIRKGCGADYNFNLINERAAEALGVL